MYTRFQIGLSKLMPTLTKKSFDLVSVCIVIFSNKIITQLQLTVIVRNENRKLVYKILFSFFSSKTMNI